MRIDKKNHPQVYLEECKYRVKKIRTPRFINTELKSDSESDSEPESKVESKSDAELMATLKSDSDSEKVILLTFGKFEIKPTKLP